MNKQTAGNHVQRRVSHVKLSNQPVVSPPAASLTTPKWKIISDGCLNQ